MKSKSTFTSFVNITTYEKSRCSKQWVLTPEHGLPKIQTYLHNPTDFAFECSVEAQLLGGTDKPGRPIALGMLSRSKLTGRDKHLIRIMPHSTLRLEAPVDQPLVAGEQTLQLGIASGRRKIAFENFQVTVNERDFPALAQQRAMLAGGVSIVPAQLELGTIKQADRTAAMQFSNTTDRPMRVVIEPRDLAGAELPNVRFLPNSFMLKPGRTKGVRAMLRSGGASVTECGVASVTVASAEGTSDAYDMPLSVLHSMPSQPKLNISPIAFKQLANTTGEMVQGFAVSVENESSEYVPINALLKVAGRSGLKLQLEDGFGQWLAPGKTIDLAFLPAEPLVTGSYTLALMVETRKEFPPELRELNVSLSGAEKTAKAAPSKKPVL